MNINIRVTKDFKAKYNKLCQSCWKDQTSMFIDTMGLIMAYCQMAEDESLDDDVKKYAKLVLRQLNINYQEFNKLVKDL